jgi:pimeloyl-ACP methyl ester carboxylesterase
VPANLIAHAADGTPIFHDLRGSGPGCVALQHSLALDRGIWDGAREARSADAATCAMMGSLDLRDRIGAITAPTEVLIGEEDHAVLPPAMAGDLASGIPGAKLAILPQARHLLSVERPDAVAAALRRLLRLA